ncbi:hypothetical protein CCMA1212_003804 [Trichoderma ghanense]|uniref:Uncharacterized protein n=1 Tax=Trichoderma ghanense TaxID=65468 RepID=A0ABY2H9D8_9HYPO
MRADPKDDDSFSPAIERHQLGLLQGISTPAIADAVDSRVTPASRTSSKDPRSPEIICFT